MNTVSGKPFEFSLRQDFQDTSTVRGVNYLNHYLDNGTSLNVIGDSKCKINLTQSTPNAPLLNLKDESSNVEKYYNIALSKLANHCCHPNIKCKLKPIIADHPMQACINCWKRCIEDEGELAATLLGG
jgi:hypothetical protein